MATTPARRIITLDIIRGVAVMVILMMNITGFAFPDPAYLNPLATPGAGPWDVAIYLMDFLLFDGKMRGLFSFLFGASMLMVILRAKAGGNSAVRTHFSRMVWLLIFGLIHLCLIWWGDILTLYAVTGMVAWFFRTLPAHKLVTVGILLLVAQLAMVALVPLSLLLLKAHAAEPGAPAGVVMALIEMRRGLGSPEPGWMAEQIALYRSGYAAVLQARMAKINPVGMVMFNGFETLAYMLFGMAGLKSGFLSGEAPRATYRRWAAIGFGVGLPVYAALGAYLIAQDFSPLSVSLAVMTATVPVRPLMIMGWAALIILTVRGENGMGRRIAATGRMAFSNYLGTSLICTTIFYGYGLGWFGALSRAESLLVVVAIWAVMLGWSEPWLQHFRYGPLEWLWRCCARGSWQRLRGAAFAGD